MIDFFSKSAANFSHYPDVFYFVLLSFSEPDVLLVFCLPGFNSGKRHNLNN